MMKEFIKTFNGASKGGFPNGLADTSPLIRTTGPIELGNKNEEQLRVKSQNNANSKVTTS
jgi:hypothetical protein